MDFHLQIFRVVIFQIISKYILLQAKLINWLCQLMQRSKGVWSLHRDGKEKRRCWSHRFTQPFELGKNACWLDSPCILTHDKAIIGWLYYAGPHKDPVTDVVVLVITLSSHPTPNPIRLATPITSCRDWYKLLLAVWIYSRTVGLGEFSSPR